MRPECLVLVSGSGTGVGKTWAAAQLAAALRDGGATVAARKPAQSFESRDDGSARLPSDADILAGATGEDPHDVCPVHRCYPLAMAPPLAAAALSRPGFTVADLAAELEWPAGPAVNYGIVEGVGGPRSPLADDGDTTSLAALLRPDHIVVVAGAGLGAINAVLLAAGAFGSQRPTVLLNRYDATDRVHVANLQWLRRNTDLAVVASVPELLTRL